jgi:hypothetical protein
MLLQKNNSSYAKYIPYYTQEGTEASTEFGIVLMQGCRIVPLNHYCLIIAFNNFLSPHQLNILQLN